MLDVSTFDGSLNATVAAEAFTISAGPVDGVLIAIVYPVLVVFKYKHHASSPI